MAKLIEIDGDGQYDLGRATTLGRHHANNIRLEDRLASRTHAELRRTSEGRYRLIDLGSTHGTFVAGRRVSDCFLANGDEIIVGATHFRFEQGTESGVTPGDMQVSVAPDAGNALVRKRIAVEPDPQFPAEKDVKDADELRRNYERLRATYELTRSIGVESDPDALLDRILDVAFRLLPADRAAVLLVDSETGEPVPRLAKRRSGGRERMVLSRSILSEVVSTKSGVLSADAGQDSRFGTSASIISQGIRSTMCVPMMFGVELLGVMHLDTQHAINVFTERDMELFTAIASQAALAVKTALLNDRIQNEAKTRVQLQRFLSPSVAEQVMSGNLRVGQRGELRRVTVLFADIRGFTPLTEEMPPADVVAMLNDYFERMVSVLFEHQGTFDKYVGDELIAIFGSPVEIANPELQAAACALEMIDALAEFNLDRVAAGKTPVEIGIGIHTGEAVCGAMGASRTQQYTAVGDTMNTGSRLCSVAKPGQIVLSDHTMKTIAGDVVTDELGPVRVKGKSEPVTCYSLKQLAH